ncbi:MAG: MATE family efflux transporter, partial [Planctomycetia bacterium]|nr:MATE family efflux transporter [Planctomycetia bacterium]
AAVLAGWTTLALAVAFMTASGFAFALAPRAILLAFTDDPRVLAAGVPLLFVAAAFQIFDGVQGVTTGNLRGLGDTHTPMVTNLLAHWAFGLPVGCALGFSFGYGVLGLWVGLSLGLAASAAFLLRAWTLKTRSLADRE